MGSNTWVLGTLLFGKEKVSRNVQTNKGICLSVEDSILLKKIIVRFLRKEKVNSEKKKKKKEKTIYANYEIMEESNFRLDSLLD